MLCDIPPGRYSAPGWSGHLFLGTPNRELKQAPAGLGKRQKEVNGGEDRPVGSAAVFGTHTLKSESFLFTCVNSAPAGSDTVGCTCPTGCQFTELSEMPEMEAHALKKDWSKHFYLLFILRPMNTEFWAQQDGADSFAPASTSLG